MICNVGCFAAMTYTGSRMRHLEASNLLTHYLSGDLSSGRRQALERHLAECTECAGWVEVYSWLGEALSDHLSSLECASFALAPETLEATDRARCAEHVERCRECRDEVELVRAAVVEARMGPEPGRHPGSLRRAAWVALAASVILAFGAILSSRPASRSSADQVLAGATLHGEEKILAHRSILVEATEVAPGASLTLESQVVAFGDGFSIKTGASLVVVTRDSADEDDSSENT